MHDPHLVEVRRIHALKVRGMSNRQIAKDMKISAPTVATRLEEYETRRKARTLFEDIDRVTEADMYSHMSIMTAAARSTQTGGE